MSEFSLPKPPPGRGRGRGGGAAAGGSPAKVAADPTKDYYTPEEEAKLIENFVEVDKCYWKYLKQGDIIRIYNSEGKFRKGGVVVVAKYIPKGKQEEDASIKLCAENTNSTYFTWYVKYNLISKLLVHPTIAQVRIKEAMLTMNDNMTVLLKELKELKKRVKALEAQSQARRI